MTPGVSMTMSEASRSSSTVPRGMARRLCWRYIDFLTLYKGLPASQVDALWNVLGTPATGDELEQCAIDLRTEIAAEADRRGLKPRDIEAELDARAATAELPSATGIPRFDTERSVIVGRDLLHRLGMDIRSLGEDDSDESEVSHFDLAVPKLSTAYSSQKQATVTWVPTDIQMRSGETGDMARAVFSVPEVKDQIADLVEHGRDAIDKMNPKTRTILGTLFVAAHIPAFAILATNPEIRTSLLHKMDGITLPVPGVPWLALQAKTKAHGGAVKIDVMKLNEALRPGRS
jgi:hypothetical protein